jgi:hypothetical protein
MSVASPPSSIRTTAAPPSSARIAVAGLIGTTVEYYDLIFSPETKDRSLLSG